MPRLPKPGKDQGQWGQILNDYLSQVHKPDGTLKDNSVPESALSPQVQSKLEIITGQQGATGPAGATGPQGATGASGTPGASGVPGSQGATGTPGTQGPSGPTGPVGTAGGQGATGATGASGVPGTAGASGTPGTNGQAGATGATGTPGQGVPTGGTTGQVLAKNSGTNFDAGWVTVSGGQPLPATSILQIDDFPGATDDAKHVAAWTAAANATRKPILQYPARTFGPLSTPIVAFSGMRAIGPDSTGSDGPKNQELSSGNYVPHRVNVSCGTGAASLFVQSETLREVVFMNISWSGTASSQWWHNTNGNSYTIYPGQFHSLAFDNFNSVLGNSTNQFTCTQFIFSGHWTVLNFQNTPIHIGGSDNSLWMTGYINANSPASVAGGGKPILHLDYLEKTDIGYVYVTAENGWSGVRIEGPVSRAVRFYGGVFEGRAAGNPATYPVIDIRGCHTVFHSPSVGQVTTANGAIVQSGGVTELYSPHYYKATAVGATYPMFYQTGGIASIVRPFSGDGNAIRIRWKDAALGAQDEDIPYPTGNSRTNWS